MKSRFLSPALVLVAAVFALAACTPGVIPVTSGEVSTAAVQTVAAQLTQAEVATLIAQVTQAAQSPTLQPDTPTLEPSLTPTVHRCLPLPHQHLHPRPRPGRASGLNLWGISL